MTCTVRAQVITDPSSFGHRASASPLLCPLHPLHDFWRQSSYWLQQRVRCDSAAAHWEVIGTMITTSIQEKSEDRERKCWHVWGELCQVLKTCPGKHTYDRGCLSATPAAKASYVLCSGRWECSMRPCAAAIFSPGSGPGTQQLFASVGK